jgi:hypothetical protein
MEEEFLKVSSNFDSTQDHECANLLKCLHTNSYWHTIKSQELLAKGEMLVLIQLLKLDHIIMTEGNNFFW